MYMIFKAMRLDDFIKRVSIEDTVSRREQGEA